jgi:phasin family protein
MPTIIEQISATAKANYDARVALFNALTRSAFDGMSKLIVLNLDVAKATLAESTAATQDGLSVKDPQKPFGPASAQPAAEKALAYARQVASITLATQAECSKTTEAAIAEIRRNGMALMEEIAKNAPAGSEQAFSLFKSTIDNIAAGYDLFNKQAQQAAGMLNGELTAAANQTPQVVGKADATAKASTAV